ncbi:MAG: response regulator transcription factor [Phycisphaerales bacterium]|jgi:DNA-binding response OmpR family regulator
MARARILIVEDDAGVRKAVADALDAFGYGSESANDGQEGLSRALGEAFDLVLLDVRMPKMDGHAVLAELRRARPGLPVIFLTARGESDERVKGLRGGADDYVVKPFGTEELVARIEAVLRRSPERPASVESISFDGLTVNLARREVTRDGRPPAQITEKEAALLGYLAGSPGRAISRDELLSRVWGIDPRGMRTRTVDMAVARLREQLGDDPSDPKFIVTVRGKGYMLAGAIAATDSIKEEAAG